MPISSGTTNDGIGADVIVPAIVIDFPIDTLAPRQSKELAKRVKLFFNVYFISSSSKGLILTFN